MDADFSELDWNFDAVPNKELVACCHWEYARESQFIRQRLLAYRKKWSCPGGELNDEIRALWNDMDKIQSIGHASDVFVRGCCFEPGRLWQSEDPEKPDYRHPHAPPLTGSFPVPWQSLSEVERKFRAHIRTHVEQFQIVPIKVSHWEWAKEIARESQQASDQRHEQRKAWERKYFRRDEQGQISVKPDAPPVPEFTELRPSIRWGARETLMVDIAWECFTNDEIATYFRKWVKANRPKTIPKPNGQGGKDRDWRIHLTRLGIMRLLARHKALEIVDDRKQKVAGIWKTKQFSGAKWADVNKWYDARRDAKKFFRKLFPFLPPEEKPLSWERKTSSQ